MQPRIITTFKHLLDTRQHVDATACCLVVCRLLQRIYEDGDYITQQGETGEATFFIVAQVSSCLGLFKHTLQAGAICALCSKGSGHAERKLGLVPSSNVAVII